MTPSASLATSAWVWTATTATVALVTAALLALLTAHVLIATVARSRAARARTASLTRRLAVGATALSVCFLVLVVARFAILLAERPGP